MKILITGATGFVGSQIVKKLIQKNHEILILTRNTKNAMEIFDNKVQAIEWNNYYQVLDLSSYGTIDGVINLMGENLGDKRWTNEQKKEIYNSRVDATSTLIKMIAKLNSKPEVFISTSAVGYYGDSMESKTEKSAPGNDFLSKVCKAWEELVTLNQDKYTRFAIIRPGMVLGKGGALEKMLKPFRLGLGGKLGSGNQIISWIHVEDLANMYIQVLEDPKLSGIFNATAKYSVSNNTFTQTLGKILRKKTHFSVPGFVLTMAMGEMSALVLNSSKVVPENFIKADFHYLYPTLEIALKDVVSKT